MPSSNERLRHLILAMLAPSRRLTSSDFAGLSDSDWRDIEIIAGQHRLGPILHYRHQHSGQSWPLPGQTRKKWQDDHHQAAMTALQIQRTLLGIAETLAKEGIGFVVLKGAWLAWNAYPNPALRPMRDIDILVSPDRALQTRRTLLANGFAHIERYTEPPEEALQARKHLPGIRSISTGVPVEIHTRLVDLTGDAEKDMAADADRDAQLEEKISANFRGNPIAYLSPTDTLLHLIVHSAYDHRMNNGPAIFDDIAFLVQSHPVDWDRFWRRATAQDWDAGCRLLLLIAERQHGSLPITWPGGERPDIPESIVSSAMLLSLQDHHQRMVVSLMGKAATSMDGSGLKGVLSRLHAPRHQLAPLIGLKAGNPLAVAAYPIWLYNVAARAVQAVFQRSARDDTAKYALVSRWLGVTGRAHDH